MFNLNTSKFLKYILFILISYLFLGFVNIDVRADEGGTGLNLYPCVSNVINPEDGYKYMCTGHSSFSSDGWPVPVYAFKICDPFINTAICGLADDKACFVKRTSDITKEFGDVNYKITHYETLLSDSIVVCDLPTADYTCSSLDNNDHSLCADDYSQTKVLFVNPEKVDKYITGWFARKLKFEDNGAFCNDPEITLPNLNDDQIGIFEDHITTTLDLSKNIPHCVLDESAFCSERVGVYYGSPPNRGYYMIPESAPKACVDLREYPDLTLTCTPKAFDGKSYISIGEDEGVCTKEAFCIEDGDACLNIDGYRDNKCAPSNLDINMKNGFSCIVGYNKEIINQDINNLCGQKVPSPSTNVPDGFFMCDSSFSEVCVDTTNGYRGNLDSTDMPDKGLCLKCVQHNVDALEGKECSSDLNPRDLYLTLTSGLPFTDTCCHPDFKCISGTCQKKTYTVCGGDKKRADELNSDNNLFIDPGEICKYEGDEDSKDFCKKRCSTSQGLNDESGNTRCKDSQLNGECTVSCGCVGNQNCDTNRCDSCQDRDEACVNSSDCCSQEFFECSSNTCQPKCPDDGSCRYNPANPHLSNICCDDNKFCSTDNKCIENGACTQGGCCGFNSICNNDGECVDAAMGGECSPFLKPIPGAPTPDKTIPLKDLLTGIVAILYPLAIILGMGYLIFGGYKLISSQGSPEEVKSAQEMLTSAIIGMIFIILSATILRFVLNFILNVQI